MISSAQAIAHSYIHSGLKQNVWKPSVSTLSELSFPDDEDNSFPKAGMQIDASDHKMVS